MSNYSATGTVERKGFTARDAITTGVFAAIIIGIRFLFMILGGLSPYMWFASHAIDALLIGPIFMLVVSRTKKTGPIFIISMITAVVFIPSTWMILVSGAICGIISEIILRAGKFRNKAATIVAYIIFNIGFIGDFMPLFLTKDEFIIKSMDGYSPEYLELLDNLISAPTLIIVIASIVGASIVGGIIGHRLNRKHFEKAGII